MGWGGVPASNPKETVAAHTRRGHPWPPLGPLGHLGPPLASFGPPLASFGPPLASFGCLWLSLERLWAPFGSLEGAVGPSLGGLWDPFWASWAALGRLVDFIENWMSLSEQMWPKYRACAQKQASQNSPADLLGSTGSTGNAVILGWSHPGFHTRRGPG